MGYPTITHHGGVESVTGSCHQLDMDIQRSLLIDCGLELDSREGSNIKFPVDTIKALILTHVHVDHVGRIPDLLAAGYNGPILCSEPSARLLPIMLEDAFKHQFGDKKEVIKRYLAIIQQRTVVLAFNVWHLLIDTPALVCRVRLQRAGHILGSAYVECDVQYPLERRDRRIVFSGDLGSSHSPFLSSPKSPERADVLILESTYGDRVHENRKDRQARLGAVIDKALADHGTVLIPAFSIGRTQELLYEIEDILQRKSFVDEMKSREPVELGDSGLPVDWPQLPILLDSPLASRFTDIYQAFDGYWNSAAQARVEQGRKPLGFKQLINVDSRGDHLKVVNYLSSTGRPAIVIAGSGMCSGGRIVDYLKAMLGDPRHNVIFVGYQAKGTPGAAIQKYGPHEGYAELDGERFAIKAGVTTVGGYSAHADQKELLSFVTDMQIWPTEIRLVHGEPSAKKTLGDALNRKYSLEDRELTLVI